jgi:hypothetical protein
MTPVLVRQDGYTRLVQAGLIASSLGLAVMMAAAGLGVLALYQGWMRPPAFAVKLGRIELSAPCPAQGFDCDPQVRYYAIWRGDQQPDGSIRYRLMYFTYLNKPSRP